MKYKRYIWLFSNLLLLAIYMDFVAVRCSSLSELLVSMEKELDIVHVFSFMKHEVVILLLSLLSLFGILFINGNRFFYWVSILFISTQAAALFFAFNLSPIYIIKVIAVFVFIWNLIIENRYSVYVNKAIVRVSSFIASMMIYILLLIMKGII